MDVGSYRIEFAPRAEREFHALSRDVQRRLAPRIDSLGRDPRPRGAKKMAGEDELYRLRVGDYRVLYQIRDRLLVVLVVTIGHRREVYR